MVESLDLVNRDPHSMNNFLQVEFDDAFGEPKGTHSSDWYLKKKTGFLFKIPLV